MNFHQQQRESRHLWVGNLPDHFDEDDIRAYFEKKFGEVEKVKLLPKKTGQGGGVAAFVDFVDIRSAQKAHNCPIVIQNREIRMNYNDPKQGRQQPAAPVHQSYPRDYPVNEYDDVPRGKDRHPKSMCRSSVPQPRGYPPHEYADMEPDLDYRPPRHRSPPPPGPGFIRKQPKRQYSSSPDSNPGGYMMPSQRNYVQVKDKKPRLLDHPVLSSASHVPVASGSGSRRMKMVSKHAHGHVPVQHMGGHANISPTTGVYIKPPKMKMRNRAAPSSSSSEAGRVSESESSDDAESSDARLDSDESISSEKLRGYHAIVVRNLPKRHKDQTIKEGLFFEFKKIGKAVCIKLEGSGKQRIAFCYFRTADECKRIVKEKDQKTFYGKAMEIDPIAQVRQEREQQRDRMGGGGGGGVANFAVPNNRYEMPPHPNHPPVNMPMNMREMNEPQAPPQGVNAYDPKCSRTLFIGNVPREIEETDLYKIFRKYGKILDIDVKRMQYGEVTYAFVQYAHLLTCVEAINCEDGRKIGPYRCKTNFAKTTPSACLWASGLPEDVNKMNLKRHFSRPHPVSYFIFDQKLGEALLYYQDVNSASEVLANVKTKRIDNSRCYVDFSSKEHQDYIMKCMKNKGDGGTRYSCSPSPSRGRDFSNSPMRRDNRRRSPSDSPPRGGGGPGAGTRGSPPGGAGPGRFSPSRRHGSHSSNRSSRSPSHNGNVGGRENRRYSRSSNNGNSLRRSHHRISSRSRSPSKSSTYSCLKARNRQGSYSSSRGSQSKFVNRSPSMKSSPRSQRRSGTGDYCSSQTRVSDVAATSNDEHYSKKQLYKEKDRRRQSSREKRNSSLSLYNSLAKENLMLESTDRLGGASGYEEDKKTSATLSSNIAERTMSSTTREAATDEEDDKRSSEPEEGEFRSSLNEKESGDGNTSQNVSSVSEAKVKTEAAEPYEDLDVMMSDQSDIEANILKSEERSAEDSKESISENVDENSSKNDERPLCDVDRGGTANISSLLEDLKNKNRKSHKSSSTVQDSSVKKTSAAIANLTTGHFLEFSGADVCENRPHSPQVATALLHYSTSAPTDLSQLGLSLPKGLCFEKKTKLAAPSGKEFDESLYDSPSRALDNYLSEARAKASLDPGKVVERLHHSSHVSSGKREEEQHETDNDDDMDSDDAMRNKMDRFENELLLEDISSPEPFSDSESQSLHFAAATSAHLKTATSTEPSDSKISVKTVNTSAPVENVVTPEATTSPMTPSFMAIGSELLANEQGRSYNLTPAKMLSPVPVIIPTEPVMGPVSSPVKPPLVRNENLNDSLEQLTPSKQTGSTTPVVPNVERKATEVSAHPIPVKKVSHGHTYKLIPLEGSDSFDPRADNASAKLTMSFKTLHYPRPSRSPKTEPVYSTITESQSIIEDWKRRGIVKPKTNKVENEEALANSSNLQRVNELLNKFNVTSIFDQDSQRLSVTEPEREAASSVSPASLVSQKSYDFSMPPSPWSNSPILMPSYSMPSSSSLNIEIPSPSSAVKRENLQGILKSPSSASSVKSDDPRLKSSKAPPFPPLNLNVASAPSSQLLSSSSFESPKVGQLRVSDKYQRKPAASAYSGKMSKLTVKTEDSSGSGTLTSYPSPVSSVSSSSSTTNLVFDFVKSPGVKQNDAKTPAKCFEAVGESMNVSTVGHSHIRSERESVKQHLGSSRDTEVTRSKSCDSKDVDRSLSGSEKEVYGGEDSLDRDTVADVEDFSCSSSRIASSCATVSVVPTVVVKVEPCEESCIETTVCSSKEQRTDSVVDSSCISQVDATPIKLHSHSQSQSNVLRPQSTSPQCNNSLLSTEETQPPLQLSISTTNTSTTASEIAPLTPKQGSSSATTVSEKTTTVNEDSVKLPPADVEVPSKLKTSSAETSPTEQKKVQKTSSMLMAGASSNLEKPKKPTQLSAEAISFPEKAAKKEKKVTTKHESKVESSKKQGGSPLAKEYNVQAKCADIDIFSSGVKTTKVGKTKTHKKNINETLGVQGKGKTTETVISREKVPSIDRGDESSENEAEKRTLEQLIGGCSSTRNRSSSSFSKDTDSSSRSQTSPTETLMSKQTNPNPLPSSAAAAATSLHKVEVNAVQKVVKHHKKNKKESKSLIKQEASEEIKSKTLLQTSADVNKVAIGKIVCENTFNTKHAKADQTEEDCPKSERQDKSKLPDNEHKELHPPNPEPLVVHTESLVAHNVLEPLKVEIEDAPVDEESLAFSHRCKSEILAHEMSPQQLHKSKSAPVSTDVSGQCLSPVATMASSGSSHHKKKRPYVEIVVDESEEQENIDYVQHQLSRPDGIEICIKKVKTELLPIHSPPISTETEQRKPKSSPKKGGGQEAKRTDDKMPSKKVVKALKLEEASRPCQSNEPSVTPKFSVGSLQSFANEEDNSSAVDEEEFDDFAFDASMARASMSISDEQESIAKETTDCDETMSESLSLTDERFEASKLETTRENPEDTLGTSFSTDEAVDIEDPELEIDDRKPDIDNQVTDMGDESSVVSEENVNQSMEQSNATEIAPEKADWIRINGENYHWIHDTSSVCVSSAKSESAFQIAESILGAIESHLPAKQTLPNKDPLMNNMPVNEKLYEYLAGLSTTTCDASNNRTLESDNLPSMQTKSEAPHCEPQSLVKFEEPDSEAQDSNDNLQICEGPSTNEAEAELSVAVQEPLPLPLHSNLARHEDEDEYDAEKTATNAERQAPQLSPDDTEADDEAVKTTTSRTPVRTPNKRRKSKRNRFTRPAKRPASNANATKSKQELPQMDAEESCTSSLTPSKSENSNMLPVKQEDSVSMESSLSVPETKFVPPKTLTIERSCSLSSSSVTETPTPPISATMHPKERLKKQYAAQNSAAARAQSQVTCLSTPGSASVGFAEGSNHATPAAPSFLTGIKSEHLTVQSPVMFSFNEAMLPQPQSQTSQFRLKPHLSPPMFERLQLPTTLNTQDYASPATIIKRVVAPSNESLKLLSSARTISSVSQELSLEREKRRNELKQLTSLSDAEIDNVEACIESVLQDNSILVKRFRCTADIESNFIDEEVRESAELLESSIEDCTNFRRFRKSRKRNAAGLLDVSSLSPLSSRSYGSGFANVETEHRSHPLSSRLSASTPSGPMSMLQGNFVASAEMASNSIQSSIDSVILRHSASEQYSNPTRAAATPEAQMGHPSPDIVQHAAASRSFPKHLLAMSTGVSSASPLDQHQPSAAKEPRLDYSSGLAVSSGLDATVSSIAASSAAAVAAAAFQQGASSIFSHKSLLGMPLSFDTSHSHLLQNANSNAALAATNNAILRSADAFRIDHANSLLAASSGSTTGSASGSNNGGSGGGGGDMHININLMAHYPPAYHPDILPALYANAAANHQSAGPTRLVTLQIPSAATPMESQVFLSRTSNLYSVFNKLREIWDGTVELKNSQARMSLRFLGGNFALAASALDTSTLNINQRMTLEEQELEGLSRNLQNENEFCVMLGLPCGPEATQIYNSHKVLEHDIAKYLKQKEAAGIINIRHSYMDRETSSVLHIFPPCDFARKYLRKLDLFVHLTNSASSYLLFILT